MLPRERIFAALDFKRPDIVPVEYHPSPAGTHEHGEKLRDLWLRYPDDFGDPREIPMAGPAPEWVDSEGRYRELRRDEWGVLWQHLFFGIAGHPLERPLDDWANLDRFAPPPVPESHGTEFLRERDRALVHQQWYFLKSGWISLFEVMFAVRRFEDVLMDLASDTAEIHQLADLITGYQLRTIQYLLKRGVDAIQLGDDFGTQEAMMLSMKTWRRFFKPRFELLLKPIHEAGAKAFFHTCGRGWDFFDDLVELGVHAIWPQLNVYDPSALRSFCRDNRVAVALHPDRGDLMTRGKPEDVRREVYRLAETFSVADGGAWFYVEIDAGFPFANVKALIETIGELRGL